MHILLTIIYGGALKPGWKMELYEPEIRHVLRLLTQILKVTYIYRRIPHSTAVGPGYIGFRDGDPITFGGGPRGKATWDGTSPITLQPPACVGSRLEDEWGCGADCTDHRRWG